MRAWALIGLVVLPGCEIYGVLFDGKSDDTYHVRPPTDDGSESEIVDDYGTTSFTITVDWTDDGYDPTDTDGDGLPDVGCGDHLSIAITDPLGVQSWDFGMTETGPYGWTGEDCFNGYGPFAICHRIGLIDELDEVVDCSVNSVVEGSTTLLDAAKDPYLTYFFSDLTVCFVFGDDPAYYAALGCTDLVR